MSYRVAFVVGLVLAGLFTSPLEAQSRRGRFGRPIDKPLLLGAKEVQGELGLTEEQGRKVRAILEEHGDRVRGAFRRGGGPPPEQGRPEQGRPEREDPAQRARQQAVQEDLDGRLGKVLEVGQLRRLDEILLQQQGAKGLVRPNVALALELSEEQVEQIRDVGAWERNEQEKLFGGFARRGGGARRDAPPGRRGPGAPDFGGMRRKRDQLRKDVEAKALAVLSDSQKVEFSRLKGEPLELSRRQLFGGRGRGGRGPGGRGPGGRGGPPGFEGEGAARRLEPSEVPFEDGSGSVPDRATFEKLSYQGSEVLIDTHLDGLQFMKFQVERVDTEAPQIYFINTKTHRAHMRFMRAVGLERDREQMRGVLVYRPLLKALDGSPGVYTFEFEPNDSYAFDKVMVARQALVAKMPILEARLGYRPLWGAMDLYEREKGLYESGKLPVYLDDDLYGDIAYLPLNSAESFGRLRLMGYDERPIPRDVVLYKTLPNEMPRVAGIITELRQTPLSHVNLRAIQDSVPNAFIDKASANTTIAALIGKNVYYKVAPSGFEMREATAAEVEAHFDHLRPKEAQVPKRDLSVIEVKPLDAIVFSDAPKFGVKTTNLAALRSFKFPAGTVPDGFGVPFHFYDSFMKHNGFYNAATGMLGDPVFRKDPEDQKRRLAAFRKLVERGDTPDWMREQLGVLQKSFPAGTAIRCRSSTNNEDLPGFSGAGLYASFTHRPDEGHLSKTIKQVFASLWTFRAFEEREFYRVDHLETAMGVLVHPSFQGEVANGVAVTADVLYQTQGNYYLNAQIGEDLVTLPEKQSVPEETLLDWWDSKIYRVVRHSNRVDVGQRVLTDEHLDKLRSFLSKIHGKFARLYGFPLEDAEFAMEIEFKVARDGRVVVKQARPWVQ